MSKGKPPKCGPKRGQSTTAVPDNFRTGPSQRKAMSALVVIIMVLFVLFIVIHIARAIHSSLAPGIAQEVVRMTDMGRPRYAAGMIIRHEEVFYAPRDGRFVPYISDTDRVRGGTVVGRIQDTDAAERITTDVRDVEDEIIRLNALRPYFESDTVVQHINTNLNNIMSSNMRHFSAKNLSEINSLHEQLTQLTDTRVQIITSDGRYAVGDIGRRHEQLLEQQRRNSTNMYATDTGIMFPIVDGHESRVTPQNMRELTRVDISTAVDHTRLFPTRDVEAGDPVFKIVGNTWYVAAFMPNEMVAHFEPGSRQMVYLFNDQTGNYQQTHMQVVHTEPHNRETFIIFRSTRNVIDFLNQRNVSIRTTNYTLRGLQISTSAISTRRFIGIPETHVHGVGSYFILQRTIYGLEPMAIAISSRSDGMVYIQEDMLALSIGDSLAPVSLHLRDYIISDAAIKRLHGVYVTTHGSAQFVEIVLDREPLETETHTLLNPTLNANLRQFDTIATDASTVTQGQIVN